ncbi:MAG: mechanosensitive ion channel family protein [Methanobacteriota archaeon]|nr:MAG: mechanosensitive ion channel family protein [Euryarchaeota archaeon]
MPVRRKRKWPTVILIILLGITLVLLMMSRGLIPNYLPFDIYLGEYAPLLVTVLIIAATKIWLDLVEPLFIRAFTSRTKSEADAAAVFQMLGYVVWFVALGAVLWIVAGGPQGIDFLSLGLVSAALIYVLQKPLLNIVGWAVLTYRRIYHLGDRIKVSDVRGYVTNISVMNTTVREFGGWMSGDTFTGRLVSIPNSQILETNVFNYTRDTKFIWDEVMVSITYESDIVAAKKIVMESTEKVVGKFMRKYAKRVRAKYEFSDMREMMIEEPRVLLTLGDFCVQLFAVYFCPVHRRREVRSRITSVILKRIRAVDNVQIAYPHVEVVPYKHRPFESRTVSVSAEEFTTIQSHGKEKVREEG